MVAAECRYFFKIKSENDSNAVSNILDETRLLFVRVNGADCQDWIRSTCVLPADKFPGNVRRSITRPQEFLPVSTLFAAWLASKAAFVPNQPPAHRGRVCNFHIFVIALEKSFSSSGTFHSSRKYCSFFLSVYFDLQAQR